jgi:hypothetical protein
VSDATNCHLWRIDTVPEEEFRAALERVETVTDTSHLTKALYRCTNCGQFYFGIWYELIDWDEGDDQSYEVWAPVSSDDEIERLKRMLPPPMSLDLLALSPRLQIEATGRVRRVCWVRNTA